MTFEHDPTRCGVCILAAQQQADRNARASRAAKRTPVFLAAAYARDGWGRP